MAEVCSSFPTAGGLYYWAAKLARTNGAAWSWFTGWFNFLGQVAITAGIDFGAAFFINAFLTFSSGSTVTAHWHTIADLRDACCSLHGLLNQFGIRLVALLNDISVWWHITRRADHRRRADFRPEAARTTPPRSFVFTHFVNQHRLPHQLVYVAADRPAAGPVHLHRLRRLGAHDRGDAQRRPSAARAASSCRSSSRLFAGWILLIGITFAIQKRTTPARRPQPWRRRRSASTRSAGMAPSCCC